MFEDVAESMITDDGVEQEFKVSSVFVLTQFVGVIELNDIVFLV